MSLSDRVRAGSEAAPWVVEAITALEADLSAQRGMLDALIVRANTLEAENASLRAQVESLQKDYGRWSAIERLMIIGDVDLRQDEDGGYNITVDPVENYLGNVWRADNPEQCVDKVVEWIDAAIASEKENGNG